ncbi:MAG: hypothetical protein WBF08_03955 [Candidatus Bathyarchaeia archaeon]
MNLDLLIPRLLILCSIGLVVVFSIVDLGYCQQWTDYKNEVDSIFRTMEELNFKVGELHKDYTQNKTSSEEAILRMKPLIEEYRTLETVAEELVFPIQWENFHDDFLEVIKLNVESVEEISLYFETEDKVHEDKSLSLVQLAVEKFQQLITLMPDDNSQPVILDISRIPSSPIERQSLELKVNATDIQTGVVKAFLNYSVNDGEWRIIGMRLDEGSNWNGIWVGSIPAQPPDNNVRYEIVVVDAAGNVVRSSTQSYDLINPLNTIPILLGVSIIAAVILIRYGRRIIRKNSSN